MNYNEQDVPGGEASPQELIDLVKGFYYTAKVGAALGDDVTPDEAVEYDQRVADLLRQAEALIPELAITEEPSGPGRVVWHPDYEEPDVLPGE